MKALVVKDDPNSPYAFVTFRPGGYKYWRSTIDPTQEVVSHGKGNAFKVKKCKIKDEIKKEQPA